MVDQGLGECLAVLDSGGNLSLANLSCAGGSWQQNTLEADLQMENPTYNPLVRLFFCVILLPWTLATIALIGALLSQIAPRVLRRIKDAILRIERPTGRLTQGVWTIHGRRYDLTTFRHPGGKWALELGRNRDATALFESYHTFIDGNRLEKVLAKYELAESKEAARDDSHVNGGSSLGQVENPTGLVFGDAFHEDVRNMAREYFKEKGISEKMTTGMFITTLVVIACHAFLGILACCGNTLALICMPAFGWFLTANVSHEASHFAVSKRPWVNRLMACTATPMFFNSAAWHVQHVIQHHVYTNDELDVDLYHFLPVARMSRSTAFSKVFSFQWAMVWLVLPTACAHLTFIVPMDLLTGQIDVITKKRRYEQCENIEDLVAEEIAWIGSELAFAWAFLLWNFWVHGVSNGVTIEGLGSVALAYTISSLLLIVFTQGAHIQAECQVDVVETQDKSWAKRQALTAVVFKPDSSFWALVSGSLNMQALHHILPGVSASHYQHLWPRFRIVCKKHGVKIKEVCGVASFFGGFLDWINELSQDLNELVKQEGLDVGKKTM
jgi:fatty acid desaturase